MAEEGRHSLLVGGVEDGRSGPTAATGLAGEVDRGKHGGVQRLEGQRLRPAPVHRSLSMGNPVGPSQGEGDRQTHVRRGHLGQRGPVGELDHRVHQRLRMDDNVDVVVGHAEEQMRLDQLETLVHQGGRVDRDERPHVPRRVRKGLFGRHLAQLVTSAAPERPAACGQDELAHLRGPTTAQALGERGVLGVHRDEPGRVTAEGVEYQRATGDERLLVGQGHRATRTQRRERRGEAHRTGDAVENDVARPGGDLRGAVRPGEDLRDGVLAPAEAPPGGLRVEGELQVLRGGGTGHTNRLDAQLKRLGGQQVDPPTTAGKRHDAEPIGIAFHHINGLGSDRTGRTEQDNLTRGR